MTDINSADMGPVNWRKSVRSNGQGNCVEVGSVTARPIESSSRARRVMVRDTKNEGTGPVLAFSTRTWAEFTSTMQGTQPGI